MGQRVVPKTISSNSVPNAKGYSDAGASLTKKALKGFVAQSGSAREDIDWNNYTLRQRGRMLYMASPVATSAIKTNRTKVVGVGLQLQSRIKSEFLGLTPEQARDWQKKTEAEFAMWAEKKQNCDATGVNNFASIQQLALQSWLMSGDCFALFKRYDETPMAPYSLRLHLIEADRIATPNISRALGYPTLTEGKTEAGNKIYDGVEVNANGAIVAYHICSNYPYQITGELSEWTRVEAYGKKTGMPNILHIMSSERPDQYRGVTYLAQVIEPLLQLRRYTESELMAALIQSFFTAWIITKGDTSEMPFNETQEPNETDEAAVPKARNEYSMGPGEVNVVAEGEDVKFGNPTSPSTGFDGFVKTLCTLVGAALEIPADILLKSFGKSYSASRAALLEAWDAFKMRRKWFVDDFCQPVYETWLAEAVALGRISAPGFFSNPLIRAAWCGARWIGPAQGYLDPIKEVKSDILAVQHAFKTHEQVTTELDGGDWSANVDQLALENKQLLAAGGSNTQVPANSNEGNDDGSEGNE